MSINKVRIVFDEGEMDPIEIDRDNTSLKVILPDGDIVDQKVDEIDKSLQVIVDKEQAYISYLVNL